RHGLGDGFRPGSRRGPRGGPGGQVRAKGQVAARLAACGHRRRVADGLWRAPLVRVQYRRAVLGHRLGQPARLALVRRRVRGLVRGRLGPSPVRSRWIQEAMSNTARNTLLFGAALSVTTIAIVAD